MPYSVEEPGADDGDTCQEVELERGLNSHVAEKVPPVLYQSIIKNSSPLSQEVFKFQQKMFIPSHSQVIDFMYSGDIILESTNFEDILKIQLVLDVTMLSDVLYKVSTHTGDEPSPCIDSAGEVYSGVPNRGGRAAQKRPVTFLGRF